jgi:hypothetical protein
MVSEDNSLWPPEGIEADSVPEFEVIETRLVVDGVLDLRPGRTSITQLRRRTPDE